MSLETWAENEIKIAIELAECDYVAECYKSAHKAFKSLLEDGHSGASICLTKDFLNKLIDGRPLTPIEDTEDVWNMIYTDDDCTQYKCNRCPSLFKYVYDDGQIEYNDSNRIVCAEVIKDDDGRETELRFYNGFISSIVNKIFPIEFPYISPKNPYKVYIEDFLYDTKNGDYDTLWITHLIKPTGEKVEINRYFKESEDSYIEISSEEFDERLR